MILNLISVFFYSIVYIPQFILIWKNKSTSGFSLITLFSWTQADFISLTGSLLLNMNINVIIIEWYHCSTSIIMILFCLYFSETVPRRSVKVLSTFVFCIFNIVSCILFQIFNFQNLLLGQIFGWLTSSIYIIGRFPQIIENWKNKSTSGVSITMYIFSMLGNIFYLLSIIDSPQNPIIYLPWITLIIVTLFLDSIILYQWKLYQHRKSLPTYRFVQIEN